MLIQRTVKLEADQVFPSLSRIFFPKVPCDNNLKNRLTQAISVDWEGWRPFRCEKALEIRYGCSAVIHGAGAPSENSLDVQEVANNFSSLQCTPSLTAMHWLGFKMAQWIMQKLHLQKGLSCSLMQHRWKYPPLILIPTVLGSILRNKHSEVEVNGLQQQMNSSAGRNWELFVMQMAALGLNVHPYHLRFIEAKWKWLLLRWFH